MAWWRDHRAREDGDKVIWHMMASWLSHRHSDLFRWPVPKCQVAPESQGIIIIPYSWKHFRSMRLRWSFTVLSMVLGTPGWKNSLCVTELTDSFYY